MVSDIQLVQAIADVAADKFREYKIPHRLLWDKHGFIIHAKILDRDGRGRRLMLASDEHGLFAYSPFVELESSVDYVMFIPALTWMSG